MNLVLSWNNLVSPSMAFESLAGYSSLSCHLCSLSVCITAVQDILAFIVSGEKSGVMLIGLLLYVSGPFSLTAFQYSIFIWCICCSDYYVSGGISFLVQSILSSVGYLYAHGHLFL